MPAITVTLPPHSEPCEHNKIKKGIVGVPRMIIAGHKNIQKTANTHVIAVRPVPAVPHPSSVIPPSLVMFGQVLSRAANVGLALRLRRSKRRENDTGNRIIREWNNLESVKNIYSRRNDPAYPLPPLSGNRGHIRGPGRTGPTP